VAGGEEVGKLFEDAHARGGDPSACTRARSRRPVGDHRAE
jgi:hypothetical protein